MKAGIEVEDGAGTFALRHGAVVIAAITSCTNTSNPAVMIGAGLLARNARRAGLKTRPWVKTSLAPGSKVVTEYLERAGLLDDLEAEAGQEDVDLVLRGAGDGDGDVANRRCGQGLPNRV